MDFTNLKPYSLSKCFQISWMAVNIFSLVNGLISWTIFFHDFNNKYSVGFRSRVFTWHIIDFINPSKEKALILFALWQDALSSWKMTSSSPSQLSITVFVCFHHEIKNETQHRKSVNSIDFDRSSIVIIKRETIS